MVLLLRDDRDDRWLDLPCRRPILRFSSSTSTSPVSPVLPQCSDSVAMGAIADTADAHSKRRFCDGGLRSTQHLH